ncbi:MULTISPECIES: FecR family protein [Butyricimonas]|uniref:FecR family protein n=1 Tax=Butyricimonas TaxID=574697 RepID=UPI001D06743B|nr:MULTISPECIES: FecR domain-containing protein [Butyricimonas]MCB6972949.1 FecR domain-containing protein [Butyricimonas synergistica]MCG4518485.1 FecR domain-containing protein [Butyricimonas sp. DFI.6.44]
MNTREIERLITKALLNDISEDEQRRLDEWLNASGRNRDFFEGLHSGKYLKRAVTDRNRVSRDDRWKRLRRETVAIRSRKIRSRVLRVAAAIIFPLMVGGMIWLMSDSKQGDSSTLLAHEEIKVGSSKAVVTLSNGEKVALFGDTTVRVNDGLAVMVNQKDTLNFMRNNEAVVADNSFTVIQIPRGGEYIVRLEDGTTVYLNSESELRIPVHFNSKERIVWLTGEAYFSVEHEKQRSFTVRTERADISVLGTEFGVRAYADEADLLTTLVQGAVEVKSESRVHRIVPGEQAKVDEAGNIEVKEVNVDDYIAWKLGRIVFVNARLEDIMRELQRWYDFKVSYSSPEQKELRFTMDILKYKEVSDIFDLMEKIKRITFVVEGNHVTLK